LVYLKLCYQKIRVIQKKRKTKIKRPKLIRQNIIPSRNAQSNRGCDFALDGYIGAAVYFNSIFKS
jgi:hypothetical protein